MDLLNKAGAAVNGEGGGAEEPPASEGSQVC